VLIQIGIVHSQTQQRTVLRARTPCRKRRRILLLLLVKEEGKDTKAGQAKTKKDINRQCPRIITSLCDEMGAEEMEDPV
jgi:hypothetical protein